MSVDTIATDAPVITVRDVSSPHVRLSNVSGEATPINPDQLKRCIEMQLALCGAAAGWNLVRFAAGVVDVLLWSAEHARTRAAAELRIWRCPTCRVALWSNYSGAGDKVRFVRVGTLDDPGALPPDVHIYTRSKLPWVRLPDGVPAAEAYYDSNTLWPAASLARRQALFG
jgi:hypothetical protein